MPIEKLLTYSMQVVKSVTCSWVEPVTCNKYTDYRLRKNYKKDTNYLEWFGRNQESLSPRQLANDHLILAEFFADDYFDNDEDRRCWLERYSEEGDTSYEDEYYNDRGDIEYTFRNSSYNQRVQDEPVAVEPCEDEVPEVKPEPEPEPEARISTPVTDNATNTWVPSTSYRGKSIRCAARVVTLMDSLLYDENLLWNDSFTNSLLMVLYPLLTTPEERQIATGIYGLLPPYGRQSETMSLSEVDYE